MLRTRAATRMSATILVLGLVAVLGCTQSTNGQDSGLARIHLPDGFAIDYYTPNLPGARSLTRGDQGTIFVGTRDDRVYAVVDTDGDQHVDKVYTIATGLDMPNGVAFRDGDLYVAEVSRVIRFDSIETRLSNPPAPVVVNDKFPTDHSHGWKFIAFGPDGRLYVPVGAPCNICEPPDSMYACITRMNPDGSGSSVFASGIRNTVGFTWQPQTGAMWFTDNGRDWLGDDAPPDELNRADRPGLDFGYPYCHGGTILDPEYGAGHNCADYTAPALALGAHVAALGLRFYTGTMFPEEYRGQLFIAEHGSWNRTVPIGYRVMLVKLDGSNVISREVFADGWLGDNRSVSGRPVDVLVMPDGALLVSDDYAGCIYRISYK